MSLDTVFKQDATSLNKVLQDYDILPLLNDWSEHDDSLIADKADLLAEKIESLLDKEGE
jgi:hypothetical protein